MGWPQMIWIVLVAMGLGLHLAKDGEPKPEKWSFNRKLIGACLAGLLLWWGGFFGHACAADIPQAALKHRADLTRNARAVWGLDAPVATFASQVHQESRWRPEAVSPVGAQGIAQFMPTTADWIAQAYPALAERQPFNPSWGLRALVTYDRHLWERIKAASVCDRMAMTLSAYNGGLGWVWRDQKLATANGADSGRWFDQVERFNAGRRSSAFKENRGYPRLILLTYEPRYIAAGWGRGSCSDQRRAPRV